MLHESYVVVKLRDQRKEKAMTTATVDQLRSPSKGLNIGTWIVQGLLAAVFGMAGLMKSTTPNAEMVTQGLAWVSAVPAFVPKLAGISEVLAAFGLILPSALRIQPKLTPLAAAGLVVIMALAIPLHLSLGELPAAGLNLVLGCLAAFVVWVRFKKAPIAPRG